ncbi:MAG: hypothetical protein AB7S87_03900 [Burkholderiales bacterium]
MHRFRACLPLATLALLAGCAAPVAYERARAPGAPLEFHVPPQSVPPLGQCRIWYAELPPEWQPPEMPCPRAHALAEKHGGRVVKAISQKSFRDGRTLSVDYGPSNFPDVPPEQLPPPGYCRPWLDRIPAERQPAPMTCERAERIAREKGGRVVYMPGPEQN